LKKFSYSFASGKEGGSYAVWLFFSEPGQDFLSQTSRAPSSIILDGLEDFLPSPKWRCLFPFLRSLSVLWNSLLVPSSKKRKPPLFPPSFYEASPSSFFPPHPERSLCSFEVGGRGHPPRGRYIGRLNRQLPRNFRPSLALMTVLSVLIGFRPLVFWTGGSSLSAFSASCPGSPFLPLKDRVRCLPLDRRLFFFSAAFFRGKERRILFLFSLYSSLLDPPPLFPFPRRHRLKSCPLSLACLQIDRDFFLSGQKLISIVPDTSGPPPSLSTAQSFSLQINPPG